MKRIRHYVLPDVQVRPGDVTDHLDWIAQDIIRRKPDVLVCIGDFWDLPSLSSYSAPGGLEKENARIAKDIDAGTAALQRLTVPIWKEVAKIKADKKKNGIFGWCSPRATIAIALPRVALNDARLEGVVGTHLLPIESCGFERVPFEQPIEIDSVWYCHYWKTAHSPRPIGGTIDNRLNKLGFSFVAGHEQGKKYGSRSLPNGKTIHGIVAGSCYLGREEYRGPQGANEWRGTVVLHDVRNGGDFEPMFLTLRWLCENYTGEELHSYMTKRYPRPRLEPSRMIAGVWTAKEPNRVQRFLARWLLGLIWLPYSGDHK